MTARFNHAPGSFNAPMPTRSGQDRTDRTSSAVSVNDNLQYTVFADQDQLKRFSVALVLFVAVYGCFFVLPVAISIIYAGLCIWTLIGPKQSLQAITLAVFIRYLNPGVFSLPFEIGPLSWLILLLALARNMTAVKGGVLIKLLAVWLFGLVVTGLTFVSSQYPMVSLMKLLSFAIGASTVLICCEALDKNELKHLWVWIMALFSAVILLSLATLPFPSLAYHRGAGFQGILNHPQSLGALIAPFASWLLASVFFQKKSLISMPVFLSCLLIAISIISETRTAMVAVALALFGSFLVFISTQKQFKGLGSLSKTLLKSGTVLLMGILVLLSYRPAQEVFMSYVFKRESQNLEEALSSRSGGIEMQWQNFLDKPVAGWGFGIYPGDTFSKDVHTFMGIPISAPVEKGFIPTALLEEVGIAGALCFAFLLVTLIRFAARSRDIRWLAVFFSCLFVNLGEMVFFSAGGIGIFYWVLMGLAGVAYKLNGSHMQSRRRKGT